jgi:hypothetical protein
MEQLLLYVNEKKVTEKKLIPLILIFKKLDKYRHQHISVTGRFDFSSPNENLLKCSLETPDLYKNAPEIYDATDIIDRTMLICPSLFFHLP